MSTKRRKTGPSDKKENEEPLSQPSANPEDVCLLFIGDMHFCKRNYLQSEKAADLILRFVEKYAVNIDAVVVLGDIIDSLQWENVARAQKWLSSVGARKRVYALIGNHDRPHPERICDTHPFHGMDPDTVSVIDKFCTQTIQGFTFGFIPYYPESELLAQLDTTENVTAYFGHNSYGKGVQWPEDKYPLVITGHEHTYAWPQRNIMHAGSVYQVKSGDSTDNAIVLARFRRDTGLEISPFQELLRLNVEQRGLFSYQRINLNLPRRETVYKTCSELIENSATFIQEFEDIANNERIIKVVLWLSGTHDEYAHLKAKPFFKTFMRNPKFSVNLRLSEEIIASSIEKMSQTHFLDVLRQNVANDPELNTLFCKLFKV